MSTSIGSTNLCPEPPISSPKTSTLSVTGARSDLVLIAAKPSTRRIVTTSETPSGQRKTIGATRIAARADGYSLFLAIVNNGSSGFRAIPSR